MPSRASLSRWIAKASPYDVLSLAIAQEQAACRQYMRFARESTHRLARAKFRYLAEEERDHVRTLAEALRAVPAPARRLPPPAAALPEAKLEGDSPEAALRVAIADERQAEKFYTACAVRCRAAATRQVFESLAEQESHHAEVLAAELALMASSFTWSSIEGAPPAEGDFWT